MSAWAEIREIHRRTTLGAKEGIAFRWFSRPLASVLLYLVKDTRLTPNQVTIFSLLVGAAGSLLHLTVLTYWGLVAGAVLFMLAHMLDALDGQLARLRRAGSEVGRHFDFFIDELKAYLVYMAIAGRLYRQALDPSHGDLLSPLVEAAGPAALLAAALVGLGSLATGISCTRFTKMPVWRQAFPPGSPAPGAPTGEGSLQARLVALAERAGRLVVDYPSYILVLCLLDRVDVYFILYTLVVVTHAARALLGISLRLWRVDPYGPAASGEGAATGGPPEPPVEPSSQR